MLRAGISFSRVSHFRSEPQIQINEYLNPAPLPDGSIRLESAAGQPMTLRLDDPTASERIGKRIVKVTEGSFRGGEANPLNALPISDLREPILYKLHGSQDIVNSCTISSDQYFNLLSRSQRENFIPDQISEIISNSPILFLASKVLDPDFRLTYYTLLRKPLEIKTHRRYAAISPTEGDERDCGHLLSTRAWQNMKGLAREKYGIEVIEQAGAEFLTQLDAQVNSRL